MKKIVKELQGKSKEELHKEATSIREEMAKTILASASQPVKDTNTVSKLKKRLAVVLTLINTKNA